MKSRFHVNAVKKYMSKRFKELLVSISNNKMEVQKEELNQHFKDWMNEGNSEQIDDVCVIGIKI